MNRVKIAPSVLSCDFLRLGEEIRAIEDAGADLIHIDVMDGHFVPNVTIGPLVVKAIRRVNAIPLDVHLMIDNPDRFVDDFIEAGADIITTHVETDCHLLRTIDTIRSKGRKAGVSLNPSTPLIFLDHVIEVVDLILIMTVNPGFGGQQYIPFMKGKIEAAAEMIRRSGREIELEVDGGVKAANSRDIVDAGATVLVMGTEIFHSPNYREKIKEIRQKIEG